MNGCIDKAGEGGGVVHPPLPKLKKDTSASEQTIEGTMSSQLDHLDSISGPVDSLFVHRCFADFCSMCGTKLVPHLPVLPIWKLFPWHCTWHQICNTSHVSVDSILRWTCMRHVSTASNFPGKCIPIHSNSAKSLLS